MLHNHLLSEWTTEGGLRRHVQGDVNISGPSGWHLKSPGVRDAAYLAVKLMFSMCEASGARRKKKCMYLWTQSYSSPSLRLLRVLKRVSHIQISDYVFLLRSLSRSTEPQNVAPLSSNRAYCYHPLTTFHQVASLKDFCHPCPMGARGWSMTTLLSILSD